MCAVLSSSPWLELFAMWPMIAYVAGGGWYGLIAMPISFVVGVASKTSMTGVIALGLLRSLSHARWYLAWPLGIIVFLGYAYLFLLGLAKTMPAKRKGAVSQLIVHKRRACCARQTVRDGTPPGSCSTLDS